MMSARGVLLCSLATILLLGSSSAYKDTIIAAEWQCVGWFCMHQDVNLVLLDTVRGTRTFLTSLEATANYYEQQSINAFSTFDADLGVYCIVLSKASTQTNHLLTYSLRQQRIISKVTLPWTYGGNLISSIELDTQQHRLLGSYGPVMLSVDMTTGAVMPLLKMWMDSTLEASQPSTFDPTRQLYYETVYATSGDTPCYFVYKIDIATRQTFPSACFPLPAVANNNMKIVDIDSQPTKKYLLTLSYTDLGMILQEIDISTGNSTRMILALEDFGQNNWRSVPNGQSSFNAASGWYWMEISGDASNPGTTTIAGVHAENRKTFLGGNLSGKAGTFRAWKAFTA